MVGSRGYSSKSWDALIRSGMSWRADSSVKIFHRSFHLESIRVSGSVCDFAYEATLISAAFSLAFFGAMRVSEIPPSSRCRAGGLQLEDLVICDDGLRAARRAELCPGGRSLGLTGMDVIWRGTRGLTWSQVLPEVVRIARVASSPTVVVIHAGGNELASFPLAELLTLMRADLDKLPGFFPAMRLVWSELIPRLVWRGARELSAMERSRRTLNQRISRFIRFKNGVVVRHHRLEGDNSGFLLPDGVHLNDAGLDIFLDGLREGVVQALHSLVAAAEWVDMMVVMMPAPGVRKALSSKNALFAAITALQTFGILVLVFMILSCLLEALGCRVVPPHLPVKHVKG
ncbi:unnamed protein product [Ranitomeya imitator]|uniref:SGNH hydrolase-type esterase domain-containing protein n=1 Tax=Ranitomeya imitator TaxID=111125 RepID=A0ABN9MLW9_9NEOB|nr:unnamed protein product [Ranitomeya imitator]